MTRREYTDVMLLDANHPETWTEADRDAYLRWRLTDHAAWARTYKKADRLTYYRTILRESVRRVLDERQALYSPRYKRCVCQRCVKPFVSQAELDEILTRRPELKRLTTGTVRALAYIEKFRTALTGAA